MNRPSEPLNAEERDLAQRLARLGGPREPAPALDAIILAAARAAVSEPAAATPIEAPEDPKVTPLRPRKPTPRWPLGMGLAASLVLAAGIGWRLQGDGDGSSKDFGASSAPAAIFHEEATEAVILEPPLERTPPPPPPPLGGAADAVARRNDVAQPQQAKAAPASSKPDFVADAPMTESIAPAEAPAASPPAGASANAVAADDALDKVSVTGSRVAAERAVGAAEYTRTPLSDRREQALSEPESKATGNRSAAAARPAAVASPPPPAPTRQNERARGLADSTESDAEARKVRDSDAYDASPPVSADSPEFRQAWLKRIRDHIAKGEQDAARNSLQEFRRRYPDIELPEDLRKLAATLPTP
jgi:resuscitation-promoting factor RpfA